MFILPCFALFMLFGYYSAQRADCGCKDQTQCHLPSSINTTRKEIFAFIPFTLSSSGFSMVLSQPVTTLAVYGIPYPLGKSADQWWDAILCPAHAAGVRVVHLTGIPAAELGNATKERVWVENTLKIARDLYMDGVNFDTEDPIQDPEIAFRYTEIVSLTRQLLLEDNPLSQTTVDVAWSPNCIDLRCYDFTGLMEVSDFVFVMAYDMRSQIKTGPCVAGPNDNILKVKEGLEAFLKLLPGKAAQKMVLGSPWYGYNYPCLEETTKDACPIKKVPFRGAPCSDAAGTEVGYSSILELIEKNMTDPKPYWDEDAKVYYFNYKDRKSGKYHQVWYDTPDSLLYKYEMAKRFGLRGVGMWEAAAINYEDPKVVKEMWGAIAKFLD